MKTCSLNGFMAELTPWLDKDHIRLVKVEDDGRLVVTFLDGMRHVYSIDDCDSTQIKAALKGLQARGVRVISANF